MRDKSGSSIKCADPGQSSKNISSSEEKTSESARIMTVSMPTLDRLNFDYTPLDQGFPELTIKMFPGYTRNLNPIEDEI